MNLSSSLALMVLLTTAAAAIAQTSPAPVSPVIPGATGFVAIRGAAMPPSSGHVYRAVFDATRAARKSKELVPALDMAGSELNALGACRLPIHNARFAVVFHGDAINGILDAAHYKAKFHTDNPNLKVIADLKRAGVKLYVCGQNLAFAHIDPKTLTPDVTVASDALMVLMTYQNDGYALLSF